MSLWKVSVLGNGTCHDPASQLSGFATVEQRVPAQTSPFSHSPLGGWGGGVLLPAEGRDKEEMGIGPQASRGVLSKRQDDLGPAPFFPPRG